LEVQRALEVGAYGYLLKSLPADELVKAIREVHAGKKRVQAELAAQIAEHLGEERVTARETEILKHMAAGYPDREIGERLCISEGTVKTHLQRIITKLGARGRTHALAIADRRGLLRF
jgi:DNA-binding NarL/FixJ family response regulator